MRAREARAHLLNMYLSRVGVCASGGCAFVQTAPPQRGAGGSGALSLLSAQSVCRDGELARGCARPASRRRARPRPARAPSALWPLGLAVAPPRVPLRAVYSTYIFADMGHGDANRKINQTRPNTSRRGQAQHESRQKNMNLERETNRTNKNTSSARDRVNIKLPGDRQISFCPAGAHRKGGQSWPNAKFCDV